jgi:HD-like signal output (HDOD) protein/CheY-like chemotaxis protein
LRSRILFVDDETMVLEGLRRSFNSMSRAWEMEFAANGEQAMLALARQPFDVVISDMRMPGMSGAELLDKISIHSPQTIRIALSGQCDQEVLVRSVGPIHQFLSKPCDKELLKTKIQQALTLRQLLEDPQLKSVVSQLRSIPSFPAAYQQIMAELQSPHCNLSHLAELISQDMGTSAKCLQLVNSAFFGLNKKISSVTEAIKLLGLDTIRALVLSAHIFSEFHSDAFDEADARWLWDHSLAVSANARTLARQQLAGPEFVEDCVVAGLLHDVGKLVLADSLSTTYEEILRVATTKKIGVAAAELEILGCTHAEIGAYLLGIWGLPYPVLQAIVWHQKPSAAEPAEFSRATVVHAACFLHCEEHPARLCDGVPLDREHLQRLGLENIIDILRTAGSATVS